MTTKIPVFLLALTLFFNSWSSYSMHVGAPITKAEYTPVTGTFENEERFHDSRKPTSNWNRPADVHLSVENLLQHPYLPNGCEVVSLAIVLRYYGYDIDPLTLYDDYMPKSSLWNGDPWTTYVGNAKGNGLGCYAPCVITTGNAYLKDAGSSDQMMDVSGRAFSYYETLIDMGHPVILWGLVDMNMNGDICWRSTIHDETVVWHRYSHCLVLTGYTKDTYIFCDPLRGIMEYSKDAVERSFEIPYKQACILI